MPGLLASTVISQPKMEKLTQNVVPEAPGVETMNWRRSGHGSSAVPHRPRTMLTRQPQDGALDPFGDRRVTELGSSHASLTGEPEDARLTGGTRSLMRRVLGLNVVAPLRAAAARRSVRRVSTPQPQVA